MPAPFVFGLPTPETPVEECARLVLRYKREAPLPRDMAAVLIRRCAEPSAVLEAVANELKKAQT